MTDDVKTKLKERSKLTKTYYKNGNMKSDFDMVIAKSNECTKEQRINILNMRETKRSSDSA